MAARLGQRFQWNLQAVVSKTAANLSVQPLASHQSNAEWPQIFLQQLMLLMLYAHCKIIHKAKNKQAHYYDKKCEQLYTGIKSQCLLCLQSWHFWHLNCQILSSVPVLCHDANGSMHHLSAFVSNWWLQKLDKIRPACTSHNGTTEWCLKNELFTDNERNVSRSMFSTKCIMMQHP